MPAPDPENPFVLNENFYSFASPYNQTILYTVHKVCNYSVFIIGLLLVALLTFLILTKTPPHFKPYSKMLFLCVLTDFVILCIDFLGQSRVRINQSLVLMSFTGPVSCFSYNVQLYYMAAQTFAATVSTSILPLQYFYRYLTIKRHKPPSTFETFLFYCISLTFSAVFIIGAPFAYGMRPDQLPFFDYAQFWFEERPTPRLLIGSIWSQYMLCLMIYLVLFVTFSYILTIWLARQTIKELHRQEYELSSHTRSLQRQFSKALLVQALTPLLTSVGPLLFGGLAFLGKTSFDYLGECIILGAIFSPVLNSASNIFFIVPYRKYCIQKACPCQKSTRIASVQLQTSGEGNVTFQVMS